MADTRTFVAGRVYFGKFAGETPTLMEIMDMEDITDYIVQPDPTRYHLVMEFVRSLGLTPRLVKSLTLTHGNIEVEQFARDSEGRPIINKRTNEFVTFTYNLVVD